MSALQVIVETPKGSNFKITYEPDSNQFKLGKILPAGLVFPFDFGFIPGTKGDDGDPLDVIIISEITAFPGCAMDCRMIGGIQAGQTERDGNTVRNDRFLVIPETSQLFSTINEIDHLPAHSLSQLESFFKNYNDQAGKQFEVTKRLSAAEALEVVSSQKS